MCEGVIETFDFGILNTCSVVTWEKSIMTNFSQTIFCVRTIEKPLSQTPLPPQPPWPLSLNPLTIFSDIIFTSLTRLASGTNQCWLKHRIFCVLWNVMQRPQTLINYLHITGNLNHFLALKLLSVLLWNSQNLFSFKKFLQQWTIDRLVKLCLCSFSCIVLMTFALLPGDALEVIHLSGGNRSADDFEILNDRLLVTRLIVNDEERQSLNVLELDEAKVD